MEVFDLWIPVLEGITDKSHEAFVIIRSAAHISKTRFKKADGFQAREKKFNPSAISGTVPLLLELLHLSTDWILSDLFVLFCFFFFFSDHYRRKPFKWMGLFWCW